MVGKLLSVSFSFVGFFLALLRLSIIKIILEAFFLNFWTFNFCMIILVEYLTKLIKVKLDCQIYFRSRLCLGHSLLVVVAE